MKFLCMKVRSLLPPGMFLLVLGSMSQSVLAFDPLPCTECQSSTAYGLGPHQLSALPSANAVLSIKGIPDVPNNRTQRIVFELVPGTNLINQTSTGHLAVIGRGRNTINGDLYHYVGTGIIIGGAASCFGVGIENFHLASISGTDWSKVIKCKNVNFQNALYRMTIDISLWDVQWSLEKLTFQDNGGEPMEVWVPVASDRCRSGSTLPETNVSMCSEVATVVGESFNNRNFSEVGLADIGLKGWMIYDLRISQW